MGPRLASEGSQVSDANAWTLFSLFVALDSAGLAFEQERKHWTLWSPSQLVAHAGNHPVGITQRLIAVALGLSAMAVPPGPIWRVPARKGGGEHGVAGVPSLRPRADRDCFLRGAP